MKNISRSRDERGVALVMAILALLLLSAVALGMMYATNTESAIDTNYRDMQRVAYSAQAGLEEARERIRTGAPDHIPVPTGLPDSSSQNVVYIVNPSTVQPWNNYPDSEILSEFPSSLTASTVSQPCAVGAWCMTQNASSTFAANPALDYKWVRITRKANNSTRFSVDGTASNTQVCWDGKKETPMPFGLTHCEDSTSYQPVFLLTSYAVTPSGATQTAQMEIAPGLPISVDAAVASQAAVILKGSFLLNGYDNCTCTPNSAGVYVSRAGRTCDNTKWALKTAGDITQNGTSGSSIAGVSPPAVQNQVWNYDIPGLINIYKKQADLLPAGTSCTSNNCGNFSGLNIGTYPTGMPDTPQDAVPKVTYFPGSVRLEASASGAGILIVDGDLDIHGGLNFYGLILVKGVVTFTGGGSQNVNMYGAVLAGQEVGAVDTSLGGSVVLQYDSCALRQFDPTKQPFNVLSRHEIQF
jgi:Tfp pilus assembly protein PilX